MTNLTSVINRGPVRPMSQDYRPRRRCVTFDAPWVAADILFAQDQGGQMRQQPFSAGPFAQRDVARLIPGTEPTLCRGNDA